MFMVGDEPSETIVICEEAVDCWLLFESRILIDGDGVLVWVVEGVVVGVKAVWVVEGVELEVVVDEGTVYVGVEGSPLTW